MKKTIGLIIVLIATLIALTGCAEINYVVEVNEDGTGEISYIYGMSKETLGASADLVAELVTSVKEQAEEKGYIVEVYEDEEMTGFKANKHLNDVTTEFSLTEVFEVFGEEYEENSENNGIKIDKTLFKTEYSQTAEMDLTEIDSEIEVKYTVKLPAEAKTNNATTVSEDGKELTWEIKTGEVSKIEFIAQEINILPYVIIGIVAIAIIAIVVVMVIILKKKHVTKK